MTGQAMDDTASRDVIDARVVFLTHYIPLYQVRVLQAIASRVRDFHVLLSTPIEPNRDFAPDWSGLNVTVQDTWTIRQSWKHRGKQRDSGFSDSLYVHIPYDTSRRLRDLNPDVVMSLELGARSLGVVRYCRKHPHTKSVLCTYMSQHTEQHRGRLRRRLRRYLVNHADALTYNGPSCKRYLQSLDVDDQLMHHFPYAADDRSVYTGPIDRDESQLRGQLLCVGQLSERKGVAVMVRQLNEYCRQRPERAIEIQFAGDGPLRGELEATQTPSNLTLRFLGNVAPADLSYLMARSSALIAPTMADEWLLVVNEAMQAGCPVIGSGYAQAVTTLVRDEENGWQYDPADGQSLARALDRYFDTSDEQLAVMRRSARETVAHRTPQWASQGAIESICSVLGIDASPDGSEPNGGKSPVSRKSAKDACGADASADDVDSKSADASLNRTLPRVAR
ncbi:MAG: glycosyltransferase family 4 protein [Pirellulaceae bacterium]|nr:glycosyltransferase family 4 protein [Pirellulaceae bacterium]